MKRIESRDNPRFKALRLLAGDHREQRLQGRTVIDGIHLVAAYRQKIGLPVQVMVAESAVGNHEIAALLKTLEAVDGMLLRDSLFKELSGVATPTGIAAVIEIPAEEPSSPSRDCVVLDAVQDAGNVGSILRSAAAAGVRDVYLGPGCAGAWSPRVLRAGQGAHFDLAVRERCDLPALLKAYGGMSIATIVAAGQSIFDLNLQSPVAWVFGNEGAGVTEAVLAATRCRVSIPMAEESESLNVAAAAAICLFEGVRQRGIAPR